jgi:MarR family transcriptional regulator, lower aerobic nicotinate degradation pathway regulator
VATTKRSDPPSRVRSTAPDPQSFLAEQPGHYIRRLQQIAVGMFLEESRQFDITPVQFATLMTISERPGVDQKTLAAAIGFDAATIGGVVDRLERRGLLQRRPGENDRRVRQLLPTRAGETLVSRMRPSVRAVQQRLLAPLPASERRAFSRMLRVLVESNNEFSRAPRKG